MRFRIGADIGGTFTDIVLVSDDGSVFAFGKVLTTPLQPDDAVIAGIGGLLDARGIDRAQVATVVHGTTLFTNALIERKGATTALVTTRGFRDAVEIGREHRYDIYDLRMRRPAPLAPRRHRYELDERILADGTVRTPLDAAEVRALAARLRAEGIEAVGLSLINAYVDDRHERRAAEILRAEMPGVALTLSSELVPEIGEHVRSSTVLANVYVKRIAETYLGRLRDRLADDLGLDAGLYVMQSDGGICEIGTAVEAPVRLVESGPAGGALAAAHFGAALGHDDVLAFDMGGTTAKACLVADARPLIASEFEVDRQYLFKKHSGLPVKVPVIEMIEIGTGGGSVARVDDLGRLRVGPDSAGAAPGPACYGQGGAEPTVTDADLVLGYLDPGFFLGGDLALNRAAAETAIRTRVAEPLGLSLTEAAWGIHQLANESMASAARIHAIERGRTIADFPVFATGGAGPVHAFGVASILRCPRVICPLGAGVMSALGFLTAPLSVNFAKSLPGRLDSLDWAGARRVIAGMEAEGREVLGRTLDPAEVTLSLFADMRYVKQGFEVRVPVDRAAVAAGRADALRRSFEKAYRAIYGHVMSGNPVEVVSWRVVASGPKPAMHLPTRPERADATPDAALKGHRPIFLPAAKALADTPVYDRYALPAGARFDGPAVIEERESTVVVNAAASIRVDAQANLVIDLAPRDG